MNTLQNWVTLDMDRCRIKTIMYTTEENGVAIKLLSEFAQQCGWEIFPAPMFNEYGVPFVKDMYMDASRRFPNCSYYMYSNGDILYSHGLTGTLEAASQVRYQW